MSISDVIKTECKKQKIPVSKLERDLGFCNAYVRGLKDKIPLDRAKAISEYLHIPLPSLIDQDFSQSDSEYYMDPATIALAQEMASRPGMKTLFEASMDLSEEDLQIVNQLVLKLTDKK